MQFRAKKWGEVSTFAFKGGPELTLDGKGRITVPARYRDTLVSAVEGRMVVTKNPAGCLSLYPQPVWDRFEADLIALPESRNALRRLYLGSATEVQIDGSSRVLLPPELRGWAGLERDVIFMGMGNSFELWDKARYAAQEAKLLEQDLSAQLDNLHVG